MLLSKPSKQFFASELLNNLEARGNVPVRILEMGCGTAEIAEIVLKKFPNVEYVGIEPYPPSFQKAKERLKDCSNGLVIEGFGYGEVKHPKLGQPFDIVFSLSVLEHVKQLQKFLDVSVAHARQGGEVIHLYDLGHALYPSNIKEWIQTRLCSSVFLPLIPQHKVARYLSTKQVETMLQKSGCEIKKITFHNMLSFVALLKSRMEEGLMDEMVKFELAHNQDIIDLKAREKAFPSICFWTTKK